MPINLINPSNDLRSNFSSDGRPEIPLLDGAASIIHKTRMTSSLSGKLLGVIKLTIYTPLFILDIIRNAFRRDIQSSDIISLDEKLRKRQFRETQMVNVDFTWSDREKNNVANAIYEIASRHLHSQDRLKEVAKYTYLDKDILNKVLDKLVEDARDEIQNAANFETIKQALERNLSSSEAKYIYTDYLEPWKKLNILL